jgi:hypothetical protein
MRFTVAPAAIAMLCVPGCGSPTLPPSSPTAVPLRRVFTNSSDRPGTSTISHLSERVTLSSEHRAHGRLGLELVEVHPDGAVTIRQNGKLKSAGVGAVFPGNGRSGLTLESSDPDRGSAILVARWAE